MCTKQTFLRTFVVAAIMLLIMPATMWAASTFGGGSGTITDPYQIYNPRHFVELSDEVKAGNTFEGVYFRLEMSVDFTMWGRIPPIGGQYYTENGATGNRRFCGTFLGNGHTLYNVTITEDPDYVGIFGFLGYGGYVSDLNIDGNSSFTGTGSVGAIVGFADNNTYIFNCTVGENVVVKVHPNAAAYNYKPSSFGGIVGTNLGRVSGCVSKATVSVSGIDKTSKLGGIAGYVGSGARVDRNYFLGTVEGTNSVGDIAGVGNGNINYCYYNTANRHGGVNGADTDGANWMGTVTLADGVSAALPQATFADDSKSYFAAGKYMLLTLDYTAPDGSTVGNGTATYMANDIVIGETERAGRAYYEFTMPDENVTITASVTYTTSWEGDGTASAPYLIKTADDLNCLAHLVNDGNDFTGTHFRVANDINVNRQVLIPVGTETSPFNGIFNGNFSTISNISHNCTRDNQGLFGHVGPLGQVSSISVAGSDIVGNGKSNIGVIAGKCAGTITMCNVASDVTITDGNSCVGGIMGYMYGGSVSHSTDSASVRATDAVGGIVGCVHGDAEITECYNYGSISADTGCGGIVGRRSGGSPSVTGCVNYGEISANNLTGGIAGSLDSGSITDCLNFGSVSNGTDCGGIVGNTLETELSNNYWTGSCTVGGISGTDVKGRAMRGYTVTTGRDDIFLQQFPLDDELGNFVGITYDGIFYLGAGETTRLLIDRTDDAPAGQFVASAGTLSELPSDEYYGDDSQFYLLTMPEHGQDIVISIDAVVIPGDVNGNGKLDVSDVVSLANHVMGESPDHFVNEAANVNGDENIDVSDVVSLSTLVMGN